MTESLATSQSAKLAEAITHGISCGRFLVKLATTEQELDEVLRLRYRVFNEELGEGIPENARTGRDEDFFDSYCDHLLLIADSKIVATYRLLHGPKRPPQGFYTETEFDFKKLLINFEDCVELGRACVAPEYRIRTTLMTLFWGLHCYMEYRRARYMLGCGSLFVKGPDDAMATYQSLFQQGRVVEIRGVEPLPSHRFSGDPQKGEAQIPPLLNIYFEFGAKVYAKPAYDPIFKCYDLLVMMDMQSLSPWGTDLLLRFDRKYLGSS